MDSLEKQIEMSLKCGRRVWELNLGGNSRPPSQPPTLGSTTKTKLLGKTHLQVVVVLADILKMKEKKNPPEYFFSIKSLLSTTKRQFKGIFQMAVFN